MKLVDVSAANIPLSPQISDETILQRNLQTLREEKTPKDGVFPASLSLSPRRWSR